MVITSTFKHMEHTPALDEMIEKKSHKLKKYLDADTTVKWICWVEKQDHHAEVIIHHRRKDFVANASSTDLYKAIDMVIHKLENQFH